MNFWPYRIFGTLFIVGGVMLSNRKGHGSFSGLGADEPTPETPRRLHARESKERVQRRYLAKKFWGTSVLAAQSSASMALLSRRTNWFSAEASREASALSERMAKLANEASSLANKYDKEWVTYWGTEHTRYSGNVLPSA